MRVNETETAKLWEEELEKFEAVSPEIAVLVPPLTGLEKPAECWLKAVEATPVAAAKT